MSKIMSSNKIAPFPESRDNKSRNKISFDGIHSSKSDNDPDYFRQMDTSGSTSPRKSTFAKMSGWVDDKFGSLHESIIQKNILNDTDFGTRKSCAITVQKRASEQRNSARKSPRSSINKSNMANGDVAYQNGLALFILEMTNLSYYIVAQQIATVISLFAFEFTRAFLPASVDLSTEIILSICFGLFILDVILQLMSIRNSLTTMTFWFDVIGTLSMVTEIMWLQSVIGIDLNSLAIAKSARIVRVNSRLLKLLKTAKIFRVGRFLKDFMDAAPDDVEDVMVSSYHNTEIRISRNPASLGAAASHKTSVRSVLLIILVTFIFPLLDSPQIVSRDTFEHFLEIFALSDNPEDIITKTCEIHPNIRKVLVGGVLYKDETISALRDTEWLKFTHHDNELFLDISQWRRTDYTMEQLRFLLLILILFYICIQTSIDMRAMVAKPLEKLTQMITKLTHSLVVLGGDPKMTKKLVKSGYLTQIIEQQMQSLWDEMSGRDQVAIDPALRNSMHANRQSVNPNFEWDHKEMKLDDIFECPFAMEFFRQYCISRFIYENYLFLSACLDFTREFISQGESIMNNHIVPNSEAEINISSQTRKEILLKKDHRDFNPFIYEAAAAEIYRLLEEQAVAPFLKSDYFKNYKDRMVGMNQQQQTDMKNEMKSAASSSYPVARLRTSLSSKKLKIK